MISWVKTSYSNFFVLLNLICNMWWKKHNQMVYYETWTRCWLALAFVSDRWSVHRLIKRAFILFLVSYVSFLLLRQKITNTLQFTILFFKIIEYLIPPLLCFYLFILKCDKRLVIRHKQSLLYATKSWNKNCNIYHFGFLSDHVTTQVWIQTGWIFYKYVKRSFDHFPVL